jgi:glutathione S-transferase
MVMKLYGVSDGPPSLAVRMALKALEIPFELVPVNFNKGEHLTEEYAKVSSKDKLVGKDYNTHLFFLAITVEPTKRNSGIG